MMSTKDSLQENVHLPASRCSDCQITWYPPRTNCPKCLSQTLAGIELPERGILYSFTVVRVGRVGDEVPYALAVADFDVVRVFARLMDWESARIGDEVSVVAFEFPKQLSSNFPDISVSYRFRPVASERK